MNKYKVGHALNRICDAANKNDNMVFISHSGGKDSCVVFDLARQALANDIHISLIIHNIKPLLGTSGDPVKALTEMHPKTLEFIYSKVCPAHPILFLHGSLMPDLIKSTGILCSIDGSRISEYNRQGKSSEFIKDGKSVNRKEMTEYVKNGLFGINQCFPIYDWTDTDVFDYIFENELDISEEYKLNGEWDAYINSK